MVFGKREGGLFWTSAIGFFQQEGERKVVSRRGGKAFSFWQEGKGLLLLLSCRLGMCLSLDREGWLLLVGESGDCRVILHPCILSSLVFHSGFLSISIPFIIASHVAHVPVGKGSPFGRRGRLLVSFSLHLSSSFFLLILHLLLFLGRVLFVFIPPCRDVVWRVGMRVWTLWSHGSGMAKEL